MKALINLVIVCRRCGCIGIHVTFRVINNNQYSVGNLSTHHNTDLVLGMKCQEGKSYSTLQSQILATLMFA